MERREVHDRHEFQRGRFYLCMERWQRCKQKVNLVGVIGRWTPKNCDILSTNDAWYLELRKFKPRGSTLDCGITLL
eukprot:2906534-Ditylum_brightwellii.AAC.1